MYEKIYQHAACLRRDRWSAGLGLLPGGQWAVGVYLKEWLFLIPLASLILFAMEIYKYILRRKAGIR